MYDRNITIVVGPGTDIWKQAMSNLPSPFPELAETISIPTSHDEYIDNQKKLLLEKESDCFDFICFSGRVKLNNKCGNFHTSAAP